MILVRDTPSYAFLIGLLIVFLRSFYSEHHILVPGANRGEFTSLTGNSVQISGTKVSSLLKNRSVIIADIISSHSLAVEIPMNVLPGYSSSTETTNAKLQIYFISRPLKGGIHAPLSVDEMDKRAIAQFFALLRTSPETESSLNYFEFGIKELRQFLEVFITESERLFFVESKVSPQNRSRAKSLIVFGSKPTSMARERGSSLHSIEAKVSPVLNLKPLFEAFQSADHESCSDKLADCITKDQSRVSESPIASSESSPSRLNRPSISELWENQILRKLDATVNEVVDSYNESSDRQNTIHSISEQSWNVSNDIHPRNAIDSTRSPVNKNHDRPYEGVGCNELSRNPSSDPYLASDSSLPTLHTSIFADIAPSDITKQAIGCLRMLCETTAKEIIHSSIFSRISMEKQRIAYQQILSSLESHVCNELHDILVMLLTLEHKDEVITLYLGIRQVLKKLQNFILENPILDIDCAALVSPSSPDKTNPLQSINSPSPSEDLLPFRLSYEKSTQELLSKTKSQSTMQSLFRHTVDGSHGLTTIQQRISEEVVKSLHIAKFLQIPTKFICDFDEAIQLLLTVEHARTPLEKLQVFKNVCECARRLIELSLLERRYDLHEIDFGADDMLNILTLLIIRAAEKDVESPDEVPRSSSEISHTLRNVDSVGSNAQRGSDLSSRVGKTLDIRKLGLISHLPVHIALCEKFRLEDISLSALGYHSAHFQQVLNFFIDDS